jgi:hypothetical protein
VEVKRERKRKGKGREGKGREGKGKEGAGEVHTGDVCIECREERITARDGEAHADELVVGGRRGALAAPGGRRSVGHCVLCRGKWKECAGE